MSRLIDLNRPITDEEREYLIARAREGEVAVNDRQFGHLSDDEKDALRGRATKDARVEAAISVLRDQEEEEDFDEDILGEVMPLKVADLRARLEKEGLSSDGNKDELQLRLLVLLQDRRDGKL